MTLIEKSLALSNIILTIVLAIVVWENRPPYSYVRKSGDKYVQCVDQHRWGTQTICGSPVEETVAEFWAYDFNVKYRTWRMMISIPKETK